MPSPRPKVSAKANAAKRCVIYTRVSTDDQARRDYSSMESQRDICRSYINIKQCEGWKEQEVIEDAGYSAKSLDRPGMQKLLEMVKRREVDVVVSYRIDRLSRSLHDFYHFWETLNEHGVEFVSATEQFDTSTTTGRFMLNLIMVFAQYERETTVQRTTDKMEERAKRGIKARLTASLVVPGPGLSKIFRTGIPPRPCSASKSAATIRGQISWRARSKCAPSSISHQTKPGARNNVTGCSAATAFKPSS